MKILLDARMYGLENSGIGRYLINLIDELAIIDKKNKYVLLLRKKYYNKLVLPKNWKKELADIGHYGLLEQIKLPQLIKQNKPDIVHFPHFNVPVFFKGKFIVTIHDMTMHRQGRDASTLNLFVYSVKRQLYKYVFKKAVVNAAKIIVPTNSVKRDLTEYYSMPKEKIETVYEGISEKFGVGNVSVPATLKKYNLKAGKYFINVGNAYTHKNIGRAIKAITGLNADKENKITLAIVSSRNVFTKNLEKVIGKYQAEEYVKLLGFLEDSELGILLKNSIAFVYPSLSEGFGLPGLEAMSAGTLVLASKIAVFKEVYKDHVIYFNPIDVAAIEKAMREALDLGSDDREKIIQKSQMFIKKYSWAKMAKQTLKIYEDSDRL